MKYHKPPWVLREVKIEVTHRCPLVCIHCSSDATPECDRTMDKDDCLRIINEAIKMKVVDIVFSGGEPLLWDGLEEVIDIAIRGGVNVVLYTSGNVDNISAKLALLKKTGIKKIVFSIFGATARVHDTITRAEGSFEKTIKAITAANAERFYTELHFVPLLINYTELIEIGKVSEKYRVSRISILRFVPHGRGQLIKNFVLNQYQNNKLKQMILKLRNNGLDIRTGSPYNILMLNEQPECCAAIDRLSIGPDLRIYPCDAFKQIKAEEIVGSLDFSVLQGFSLKECWNKSPFLEAVRTYLTTDFVDPCRSCKELEKCLSGCLAQKVIATGDMRKQPDPMCMLGKKEV